MYRILNFEYFRITNIFELLSFAKVCPIFYGSLTYQFDRNEKFVRQKLAQFLSLISGICSLIFMELLNYFRLQKYALFFVAPCPLSLIEMRYVKN